MSPQLSIIIPVFNVEKYLRRCLDSVLSQSFLDYELLLIDDGSSDTSGTICDEYAEKDERVRVFHKPNGGVSSARNIGLDRAKGEWIYFVDADDEVLPDGLLKLVAGIRDDVDVIMGGLEKCDEDGLVVYEMEKGPESLSRKDGILINYGASKVCTGNWGWMTIRLFRNSIIQGHQIRFDADVVYNEDELFVVRYLCACTGKTHYINSSVYRYYESASSVMESTKRYFNPKMLTSFSSLVRMYQCIADSNDCDDEMIRVAKDGIINRYLMIRGQMEQHNAIDRVVLKDFRHQCIHECGLGFVLGYMLRRTFRRTKNIIKRKLKI